jgi:hypothetical protein
VWFFPVALCTKATESVPREHELSG